MSQVFPRKVSRASQLHISVSSFDWSIRLSVFFAIGQGDDVSYNGVISSTNDHITSNDFFQVGIFYKMLIHILKL